MISQALLLDEFFLSLTLNVVNGAHNIKKLDIKPLGCLNNVRLDLFELSPLKTVTFGQ
jgi:hypothetical protein